MRAGGLVQHHILWPQARLDHLITPRPANGQDALKHEKMLDDLVGMARRVFADRLVNQTQRKLSGFECARVTRFGRASSADVPHLRPLQFGKTAASWECVPVEALVGMTPDVASHLGYRAERLNLRD